MILLKAKKDLNYWKKKLLSVLKGEAMEKSLEEILFPGMMIKSLPKETQGYLRKGKTLPVGTIREWSGKKYKKLNSGKWMRTYTGTGERGEQQAVRNVMNKIQKASSMEELTKIISSNMQRFKDDSGKTLPVVKEFMSAARGTGAGKKEKGNKVDKLLSEGYKPKKGKSSTGAPVYMMDNPKGGTEKISKEEYKTAVEKNKSSNKTNRIDKLIGEGYKLKTATRADGKHYYLTKKNSVKKISADDAKYVKDKNKKVFQGKESGSKEKHKKTNISKMTLGEFKDYAQEISIGNGQYIIKVGNKYINAGSKGHYLGTKNGAQKMMKQFVDPAKKLLYENETQSKGKESESKKEDKNWDPEKSGRILKDTPSSSELLSMLKEKGLYNQKYHATYVVPYEDIKATEQAIRDGNEVEKHKEYLKEDVEDLLESIKDSGMKKSRIIIRRQ